MKKYILILAALMACAVSYADDSNPCPCADGTQPYTVDCDGDGTPEKCAGEKCCNSDAGDYATTSIPDYSGPTANVNIGPWEVMDCAGLNVTISRQLVNGTLWEIKSKSGMAPLSQNITGGITVTGGSIGAVNVSVSVNPYGQLTVYEYKPCSGTGCGDEQEQSDEISGGLKESISVTFLGGCIITGTSEFLAGIFGPPSVPLTNHKYKKCE